MWTRGQCPGLQKFNKYRARVEMKFRFAIGKCSYLVAAGLVPTIGLDNFEWTQLALGVGTATGVRVATLEICIVFMLRVHWRYKVLVGARCVMLIITVFLWCMFDVRCVSDESFMIRVMCLVTHDTKTCGMVICAGNNYGRACTEVRRIDWLGCAINYLLFVRVCAKSCMKK